jgi:hypothetical protein
VSKLEIIRALYDYNEWADNRILETASHLLLQLMTHAASRGTHHCAETAMATAVMGKPMRELYYSFFEIKRSQAQGVRS